MNTHRHFIIPQRSHFLALLAGIRGLLKTRKPSTLAKSVMMLALATCMEPGLVLARARDIPAHARAIVLFDGTDLKQFESFFADSGLNSDPNRVFEIQNRVLHISGKQFGYLITRQSFANYYLRAEFKWGERTYPPRQGQARDSGILYNVQGPQKVWPQSIEFQINEGSTGDFWMTDGAALTGKDGERVTAQTGGASRIDRFHKGPWKNVSGYRNPINEVEKPHGKWNLVELVTENGHLRQYVNGKLVNEGWNAFPSAGKILIQSEGAEVYFRNVKLYPLKH